MLIKEILNVLSLLIIKKHIITAKVEKLINYPAKPQHSWGWGLAAGAQGSPVGLMEPCLALVIAQCQEGGSSLPYWER